MSDRIVLRSAAVGMWVLLAMAAAAAAQPASGCAGCHVDLPGVAAVPVQLMADDVHAARDFDCTACHGGDPAATDRDAAKAPETGYRGVPSGAAVIDVCGGCHSDPAFMRGFAPSQRVDQAAEYAVSGHGLALAAGVTGVATCISCHGAHGVRAVSDTQSPVFPVNVADTCGACHADPDHMAGHERRGRAFPTDQTAAYQRSAHYEALTAGRDLSAPTCNDCHGNHGAAPPGVDAVANVCGTCHSVFAERFEATTHAFLFQRGCAECHDHHATRITADDRLTAETVVCTACHAAGDDGLVAATAMGDALRNLAETLRQVDGLVARARVAGMEMSDAELDLAEARNYLTLARTDTHTVDPAVVSGVVDEGLERVAAVETAGLAAMAELRFRRRGLVVSLAVILLFVVALYFKVRELDTRPSHHG